MKLLGVDFTESFYPVVPDTSTRIPIWLTLYYEYDGWIVELCDVEAAFFCTNLEVEMYIEWPEGILDLGIITTYFLEEYWIFLGKTMNVNVDVALSWLIVFAKYLVNKCNPEKSKSESYIFFRKYEKGKLELVMSVNVDNIFMADKPETLKDIKEKTKEKFNVPESGKARNFLRVYYKWSHGAKSTYETITIKKDVKKFVEGYDKYTGCGLKFQKTPAALGITLSKSDLEELGNINKHRSFVVQLMWYITNVGPDVENAAIE